jgi:glycosyltransferase involved in cell wall biosynthesis
MRVIVKPNSVDASVQATRPRKGALFVGRLSNEKGIRELVGAWPAGADPIRVVGDGPLAGELRDLAKHNVLILGARSRNEIRVLLSTSRVLVVPSLWYEGLPLAVLEAASEGTPVVSFRLGAMEEVVGSVAESCLASPGDVSALISVALGICHASELVWGDLSARFRAAYEAQYTHAANLESLLGTYALALRIGAAGSPLSAKQKRASAKG